MTRRVELHTFDDAMLFVGEELRASGAAGIDLEALTVDSAGVPVEESKLRVWVARAQYPDGHTVEGHSTVVESNHYAAIVQASSHLLRGLGLRTAADLIDSSDLGPLGRLV